MPQQFFSSSRYIDSPPEAAIEATPENTPFATPVKVSLVIALCSVYPLNWLKILNVCAHILLQGLYFKTQKGVNFFNAPLWTLNQYISKSAICHLPKIPSLFSGISHAFSKSKSNICTYFYILNISRRRD